MSQRHTTIVKYNNMSDRSIVAFNAENVQNSFLILPKSELAVEVWISHHEKKPLVLSTAKGVCRVWEHDWKIYALWEHDFNRYTLAEGAQQGVNGKVDLNIHGSGDIILIKAKERDI